MLPPVFDVALAVTEGDPGCLTKEVNTVGILPVPVFAQVLTLQFLLVGMHHHYRFSVDHPIVFLIAGTVAHSPDVLRCLKSGFGRIHQPAPDVGRIMFQDSDGDGGELPDHFLLQVEHVLPGNRHDNHEQGADEQDKGGENRQKKTP